MSDLEMIPLPSPSLSGMKTFEAFDAPEKVPSSTASAVVPDKAVEPDESILLRVIHSDSANEVHFRVKPGTELGRMKSSYTKKMGLENNVLRFIFDGHRLSNEDTPKSLGLVDLDIIEVYQERIGGK